MNGFMLRYYFLKKLIAKLPKAILSELNYDDSTIFDLASFMSTPFFYKLLSKFRRDKYKLYDKYTIEKLEEFLLEGVIILSKVNDYKKLLLLYAIEAYISFNKHIIPYIEANKSETTTLTEALNDLDYYYTLKYDNIDISRVRISKIFPKKFEYESYMEDLIHKPFIKCFSFFLSKEYMKKAYKNKNKFFKKHTKRKSKFRLFFTRINDKLFYNKLPIKLSELSYNDVIDTKILNLEHLPYNFLNKNINLEFDEFLNLIINNTYDRIYAINEYLFYKKPELLLKRYKTDIKL